MVNLAPFSKSRSVGWEDILSGVCTLSKFPAATEKNTYVGGKVISSLHPAKNLDRDASSSFRFIILPQPG